MSEETKENGWPDVPVVTLSIHEVKGRDEKKKGKQVLELKVLGDRHTLLDVAVWIFKFYADSVREEGLGAHLWRFELCKYSNVYGLGLTNSIPLLSDKMMAKDCFNLDLDGPRECRIRDGSELIFRYDEGSPMLLRLSASVAPKGEISVSKFPIVDGVEKGPIENQVESELEIDKSLWTGEYGRDSDDDDDIDSEEEFLRRRRELRIAQREERKAERKRQRDLERELYGPRKRTNWKSPSNRYFIVAAMEDYHNNYRNDRYGFGEVAEKYGIAKTVLRRHYYHEYYGIPLK